MEANAKQVQPNREDYSGALFLLVVLIATTVYLLSPFISTKTIPGWGDDPVFCVFTLGALAKQFSVGLTPWHEAFWDIPMFVPKRQVLALSDPLLLPGFLVFVFHHWLTLPLFLSVNIVFVVLLLLGWLSCWLLLRALGFSRNVAISGGWLWAFSPSILSQSAHFQNTMAFAIPLVLAGAVSTWHGKIYGNLLVITGILFLGYSNLYYLYIASFALMAIVGVLFIGERSFLKAASVLGSFGVALFLCVPIGAHYMGGGGGSSIGASDERPFWLQQHFAARLKDYFTSNLVHPWWTGILPVSENFERNAFSGISTLFFAIAGLIIGICPIIRRRKEVIDGGALAVFVGCLLILVGCFFSSGPLFAESFYQHMRSWIPGFAEMRAVGRFGILVVLGEVVLSVIFLQFLARSRSSAIGKWALVALIIFVQVFERVVPEYRRWQVSLQPDEISSILSSHALEGAVWEISPGDSQATNLVAMRRALFHSHPIINGYSGYEPEGYSLKSVSLLSSDCQGFINHYNHLLQHAKLIVVHGFAETQMNRVVECLGFGYDLQSNSAEGAIFVRRLRTSPDYLRVRTSEWLRHDFRE
jgi:hypothetical protein